MAAAAIASGAVALPDAGAAAGAAVGTRRRWQSGLRPGPASPRPVCPALARRPDRLRNWWLKPARTPGPRSISRLGLRVGGLRTRRAGAHRRSPRHRPRCRRAFLALASRSSESLLAARSAAAESRDRRSSAAFAASSERRCEAGLRGCLRVASGPRVIVGAAVIAVGRRAVVDQRRETVVAARLVGFAGFRRRRALERQVGCWICCHAGHGRPFADECGQRSARTGPAGFQKIYKFQMVSGSCGIAAEPPRRRPFVPGGKICRSAVSKTGSAGVIASREYGLY